LQVKIPDTNRLNQDIHASYHTARHETAQHTLSKLKKQRKMKDEDNNNNERRRETGGRKRTC
jgi:uncharacterized protein YdcH (DUF465 family)